MINNPKRSIRRPNSSSNRAKTNLSSSNSFMEKISHYGRTTLNAISRLTRSGVYKAKGYLADHKKKSDMKIRRTGRERVYRLKGYTTVAKVNRKRHAERQQRFLRKFLFVIIAVLILVVLFTALNPFKDMSEFKKILGIESVDDLRLKPDNENESDESHLSEETDKQVIIITDPTTEIAEDD